MIRKSTFCPLAGSMLPLLPLRTTTISVLLLAGSMLPLLHFCHAHRVIAADSLPGFKLPSGFSIHEYAGSDLVNDLQCMTIDANGRVYVANRGSIVLLPDDNNDDRADKAIVAADFPKDGAMGLLIENDWLYFTGDSMVGRVKLNAAGLATGKPESILPIRTGNEHAAHAIRRGPDGWLYLVFGNMSEIEKVLKLPQFDRAGSPVTKPIAGGVLRISPDFKKVQIVCDGFRNPYDMDFGPGGFFTFDSDNERCVSLPWYEGTRFYQVIEGGHYGWQNPQRAESWRLPPYFFDVVPPLADLGRGSPTGVTCYRPSANHGYPFPHHYDFGVFLCDWTFGTIRFARLNLFDATTLAGIEPFLESTGENGFAPSASFVHPLTGELFVAIGGRGTRGAVYRIRNNIPTPHRNYTIMVPRTKSRLEFRRELESAAPQDLLRDANGLLSADFLVGRRLDAVRKAQLAIGQLAAISLKRGTVFEGYVGAGKLELPSNIGEFCCNRFPTGDRPLDREISRLFAINGVSPISFVEALTRRWTDQSDPLDDIHYLIVFARLAKQASAEQFDRAASALLALDRKLDSRKARRDRNWPVRISEIQSALASVDPTFDRRLLADRDFGRFDHALFAKHAGFDRTGAARIFLDRLKKVAEMPPTPDVIEILGSLPASETATLLRSKWDEFSLRPRIAALLAKSPDAVDLDRFMEGAKFSDWGTAKTCIKALEKLQIENEPSRLADLLAALKNAESAMPPGDFPDRVRAILHRTTNALDDKSTATVWSTWLKAKYPREFADKPADTPWRDRLLKIDWTTGRPESGAIVFRKLACANCHNGNRAAGPDLLGVAGRFSREDLFQAIFEPNRDVASRYRTTVYSTHSGQTYEGMVVYQAADGVILQTGLDKTVRIPADDIALRRSTTRSLMPNGLLDRAAATDLADLYAYLKSLKK